MSLFLIPSCKAKEEELKCNDVSNINEITDECFYLFVYKTTCSYCVKDYYYVNEYNNYENKDIKIYSYNLDNGDLNITIDSVPTLILYKNEEGEIVANGYLRIRNYLNKLMKA